MHATPGDLNTVISGNYFKEVFPRPQQWSVVCDACGASLIIDNIIAINNVRNWYFEQQPTVDYAVRVRK